MSKLTRQYCKVSRLVVEAIAIGAQTDVHATVSLGGVVNDQFVEIGTIRPFPHLTLRV